MAWEVELHDDVDRWFEHLCKSDPECADLVAEAIDVLAAEGPTLGRPLVDRIQGSKYHRLKELRPASPGTTEIRILFVFDPLRCAILLVAGDKSGNWQGWYDENVPVAERRYTEHLTKLDDGKG